MMPLEVNPIFAVLDSDLHLERVAGGNETEVYRTDDGRYVVKLKEEANGSLRDRVAQARAMKAAASEFAAVVGIEHSIPSYYVIAQNKEGHPQVMIIQPFLRPACPLFDVDYTTLTPQERQKVADQLRQLMRRSLDFYRRTGQMPDMYGRSSSSYTERKRLNTPWMLPWRLWSFLVKRNLLRSHNLMLTETSPRRVVLVDYDAVNRGWMYKRVYYLVRLILLARDAVLIRAMERTGKVPRGE